MKRRAHSSIDRLPASLREQLARMLVDNEWPADFVSHFDGHPRLEDCVAYVKQKGFEVSDSALQRWWQQLRTISRMKQAGLLARETMAGLTDEDAPKTQKAAAEMMTALLLEFMADKENYSSKQLKEISQAIRDCANVAMKADNYIREQTGRKVAQADKAISTIARKKKIDPEVLKQIREEVYGIIEK